MRLSEFEGKFYKVIRDGEFATLGNVTSHPAMPYLTFAIDEQFIGRACKMPEVSCILCPEKFADLDILNKSGKGIAVSTSPKCSFHQLHNYLAGHRDSRYINAAQYDTKIGHDCKIHPSAKIASQNVSIGNNVTIEEDAIIREGVSIGDNALIMAGTIIGYSECLFGRNIDGNLMPLISAGLVKIKEHARIGSYSVVGRGLFPYETTEIGEYSMIGYSVDVSHNCKVGRNTTILDQSQICGNTVIGDDVHVSPQVIVSNRLQVGDKADITIGSVVVNNVKAGIRMAGNFAIEHSKFLLWHRNKLRIK